MHLFVIFAECYSAQNLWQAACKFVFAPRQRKSLAIAVPNAQAHGQTVAVRLSHYALPKHTGRT